MSLPQTVTVQLDVETGEDLFAAHAIALLISVIMGDKACHALTLMEVHGAFGDGSYTDATMTSMLNKFEQVAIAGDARMRGK